MTQTRITASLPFYKGSFIIEGTRDSIDSIVYTSERLDEEAGFGEVHNAYVQLKEYANGQRQIFDLKLNMKGTSFQKDVYHALQTISFQNVISYKDLATLAGYPKAARAVGQAMANNQFLIVVPCHRVLASDGRLGGFSGGLGLKEVLLDHEGYLL